MTDRKSMSEQEFITWLGRHSIFYGEALVVHARLLTELFTGMKLVPDGMVLVPRDALADVVNLAGMSVVYLDMDDDRRKSFGAVAVLTTTETKP